MGKSVWIRKRMYVYDIPIFSIFINRTNGLADKYN